MLEWMFGISIEKMLYDCAVDHFYRDHPEAGFSLWCKGELVGWTTPDSAVLVNKKGGTI